MMESVYVFENKDYEQAIRNIKAALFDIVLKEEGAVAALERDLGSLPIDKQNELKRLITSRTQSLNNTLRLANSLTHSLENLDSFTRDLKALRNDYITSLIMSIDDKKVLNAYNKDIRLADARQASMTDDIIGRIENEPVLKEVAPSLIDNVQIVSQGPTEKNDVRKNIKSIVEMGDVVSTDDIYDEPKLEDLEEHHEYGGESIPNKVNLKKIEPVFDNNKQMIKEASISTTMNEEVSDDKVEVKEDETKSVEVEPNKESADTIEKPKVDLDVNQEVDKAVLNEIPSDKVEVKEDEAKSVEVEPNKETADTIEKPKVDLEPNQEVDKAVFNETPSDKVEVKEDEAKSVEVEPNKETADTIEKPKVDLEPNQEVDKAVLNEIPSDKVEVKEDEAKSVEVEPIVPKTEDEVVSIEKPGMTSKFFRMTSPEITKNQNEPQETVIENPDIENNFIKQDVSTDEEKDNSSIINENKEIIDNQLNIINETKDVVKNSDIGIIDKLKFRRTSANITKAILVTRKQFDKLSASQEKQEVLARLKDAVSTNSAAVETVKEVNSALQNEVQIEKELIQNGLLEPTYEQKQKRIEDMLEEANNLYKAGQAEDAKKMYDEISILNKELQEESSRAASM